MHWVDPRHTQEGKSLVAFQVQFRVFGQIHVTKYETAEQEKCVHAKMPPHCKGTQNRQTRPQLLPFTKEVQQHYPCGRECSQSCERTYFMTIRRWIRSSGRKLLR